MILDTFKMTPEEFQNYKEYIDFVVKQNCVFAALTLSYYSVLLFVVWCVQYGHKLF